MNGIGTLILLGILIYFLFSRNGGVGCCGGHTDHGHTDRKFRSPRYMGPEEEWKNGDIIQLRPDEYEVLPDGTDKTGNRKSGSSFH